MNWARAMIREWGVGDPGPLAVRATASGAVIIESTEVVLKTHAPGTDPAALEQRLSGIAQVGVREHFVQPLHPVPVRVDGRLVSIWPRAAVVDPVEDAHPWWDAGRLLARLHRSRPVGPLPDCTWRERVSGALERALELPEEAGAPLASAAAALLEEMPDRPPSPSLVHGDWHLGQMGRLDAGWRLLDIDSLGMGDPLWDLARPAGFWSAGLLDDLSWMQFTSAYRTTGGPALPQTDDFWPVLDLPARTAIVTAAIRAGGYAVSGEEDGEQPDPTAAALLEACQRMAR